MKIIELKTGKREKKQIDEQALIIDLYYLIAPRLVPQAEVKKNLLNAVVQTCDRNSIKSINNIEELMSKRP